MNGSISCPLSLGEAERTYSLANSLGSSNGKRRPRGALLQNEPVVFCGLHSVVGSNAHHSPGWRKAKMKHRLDYEIPLTCLQEQVHLGSCTGAVSSRKSNRSDQRSPQGRQKRPGEFKSKRWPDCVSANTRRRSESWV
jgi:hypothetical protein